MEKNKRLFYLACKLLRSGVTEQFDLELIIYNFANSHDIEIDVDKDVPEIIKEAKETLIKRNEIEKIYNHKESTEKYVCDLAEAKKNGNKLKGITSHIPEVDRIINGWQHGLVYLIGGLKKTGKSRFAINLISGFLNNKMCGIMFSMEMSEKKVHDCVIASRLEIDTGIMGTSELEDGDYGKIVNEMNRYSYQNFYISRKSNITPEYVRGLIASRKEKHKVDFVIIDYIQRMGEKAESKTKEMEKCALMLADIARDENVMMIILSQLSGEAEKSKGDLPIYAFIKESQAITESADCVLIMNDPNRGKEIKDENYKDIKLMILQRDGVSDRWVDLRAELQYSKFKEGNNGS